MASIFYSKEKRRQNGKKIGDNKINTLNIFSNVANPNDTKHAYTIPSNK